jgi:hypothetical protein
MAVITAVGKAVLTTKVVVATEAVVTAEDSKLRNKRYGHPRTNELEK